MLSGDGWRRSPQDVDPLSWFSAPRMPLVIAAVGVAQGLLFTFAFWDQWTSVTLQFLAMPPFLIAGWLTSRRTRVTRPRLGYGNILLILALSWLALLLSAAGAAGSTIPIEQWWPTIASALTLAGLAPYISARSMIGWSLLSILVVGVIGLTLFRPPAAFWSPVGIFLLASAPLTIGAATTIVFIHSLVCRTLAFLASEAGRDLGPDAPVDSDHREVGTVARVSARVAPFLEGIAESGRITAADRALAAHIARSLRSELVLATSGGWLDDLARTTGIVVSDPSRRADALNESQRVALQALIVGATDSDVVDRDTVLVELRGQPDGSTAVAISIDVDLPEGRRLMMLAPYYLTLRTTVDDLTWSDGRSVRLKFRVPPG